MNEEDVNAAVMELYQENSSTITKEGAKVKGYRTAMCSGYKRTVADDDISSKDRSRETNMEDKVSAVNSTEGPTRPYGVKKQKTIENKVNRANRMQETVLKGFDIYERRSRESQKAMTQAISQLTKILLISSMQGGVEKDRLLCSMLENVDSVNQSTTSDQNEIASNDIAENSVDNSDENIVHCKPISE